MNIIQRGIRWFRERFGMTNNGMTVKEVYKEKGIRSSEMTALQAKARQFYKGEAPHNNAKCPSLRLPTVLCNEVSRDIFNGSIFKILSTFNVVGDKENAKHPEHIEYLNEQLKTFVQGKMLNGIIKCLADGTIALRPFARYGKVSVVVSPVTNFVILAKNELGEATSIAFKTTKVIGEKYYTLYEILTYMYNENDIGFMDMQFQAFESDSAGDDGDEVPVASVPGWEKYEGLKEPVQSDYPWWVVVKTPLDNTVDDDETPYGVPLYAYSFEFIKDADEHYQRIKREMRVTEARMFTNHQFTAIAKGADGKPIKDDKGHPIRISPADDDGFYVLFDGETQEEKRFIEIYNPDPRIPLLRQYMEIIYRQIEYTSSQSYGTISETPSNLTPSATQINATKRKNVRLNEQLQNTWDVAMHQLMNAINEIAKNAGYPNGEFNIEIEWDASLKRDEQLEITKAQRQSENDKRYADTVLGALQRGVITPEQANGLLFPELKGDYVEAETLYPNAENTVGDVT